MTTSTTRASFGLFAQIGAEAARICEGLTDEQWEQPSSCAGWQVKHLIAHQASGTTYPLWKLLGYRLRHRSAEAAGHHMAIDMGDRLSREQVLAEFRRGHGTRPANLFARFSDVDHGVIDAAVHLGDLRRSVGGPGCTGTGGHADAGDSGVTGELPREWRELLLDLIPVTGGLTGTATRVAGLTLHASDLDRSVGGGPVVAGRLESLLMAAAGRREALAELSGPGLETLVDRVSGSGRS